MSSASRPAGTSAPPPPAAVEAVRAAHARGARVVSLCSGAFVLAAAGLLDGRRSALHWKHAPVFAGLYPAVEVDPSVLYIDHGDVLTGAGNTAGIDLCLHLVRQDLGFETAGAVARQMVVPRTGRAGRRSTSRPRSRSTRTASGRSCNGRRPGSTGPSPSPTSPPRPDSPAAP
ncbi:DJ-1/PfpI family protein [Actinomadura yumaensis]|uniref:DJ-1/PfpI family protein n=1 Tax=Actinomadura yumaensis TaxID=111807 RepID=UPI003608A3CC